MANTNEFLGVEQVKGMLKLSYQGQFGRKNAAEAALDAMALVISYQFQADAKMAEGDADSEYEASILYDEADVMWQSFADDLLKIRQRDLVSPIWS